jgi:hypothetical protein
MDVQVINSEGIERCDPRDLPLLLKREDALVWEDPLSAIP